MATTIDKFYMRRMVNGSDADWKEELHPRGEGGKFAKKGSAARTAKTEKTFEQEYGSAPKQTERKAREKKPYNPKAFGEATPQEFIKKFHAAKAEVAKTNPQDAWRVDSSYTEDDYKGMKCFATNGGSTVAVHDGDIVSVCHNPNDAETRGSDLLQYAVENGGNKLDAFGKLYGFYVKNGFEPVSWCEFADVEGIRPDDWVRERDEKEPVIFFKYTGRSADDIKREFGNNHYEYMGKVKASEDYGAAQKIRDDSIRGMK